MLLYGVPLNPSNNRPSPKTPKQEVMEPSLEDGLYQAPIAHPPPAPSPTISTPHSPSKAKLLIANARIDHHIRVIQKNLADHLVQRDLLRLNYNRLQVEQARQSVVEAEFYVGHVQLAIRKSRHYASLACLDSLLSDVHEFSHL
ncbi:hypothetical protein JVT61DRAFT_14649 [Boletus reticuloceps]|uniref:Uncharacterized protein n=1 Tax=Boletus reticuloceps TaxID=495285 RepID=A0A8I2YUZ2_9AGAM|nr:hypothetical protein JVT61DRAFT_14649 [Boletus reticuloceps]